MYFGSVRFYRHLIFAMVFLPIIILTITVLILLSKINQTNDKMEKLEMKISKISSQLEYIKKKEKTNSLLNNTTEEKKNINVQSTETAINPNQKKVFDTYPLLSAVPASTIVNPDKTIYITFDDGPSLITLKILDILKVQGIKATFFVIGKQIDKYPEIFKRMVDEGHSIGIHTDTHNYEQIYSSLDAFLHDYEQTIKKINNITNQPITIYRLPGGSINVYNKKISSDIISELGSRGFVNFDWNISAGDATKHLSTSEITTNIISGAKDKNVGIVLMHDSYSKDTTGEALPEVINQLRGLGYSFNTLNNEIKTIQFQKPGY